MTGAELAPLLGRCAAGATGLLLLALVGAAFWRWGSAAQRHLFLCVMLMGTLLLPLAQWSMPKVEWAVAPAELSDALAFVATEVILPAPPPVESSPSDTFFSNLIPPPPEVTPVARWMRLVTWVVLLWLAGAIAVGGRFLLASKHWWRLRREATPAAFALEPLRAIAATLRWKTLPGVKIHPLVRVPVVLGLVNPVILLPTVAASWPKQTLDAVLRHEAAHLSRGDLWMQAGVQLALACYWFHPLAWWVAARIRHEREQAFDDRVLSYWGDGAGYAEGLLEVVRSYQDARLLPGALGMARRGGIAERIRRVLAPGVNRVLPSRRMGLRLLAGGLFIACLLGSLRLVSYDESAAIKAIPIDTVAVRLLNSAGEPVAGARVEFLGVGIGIQPTGYYSPHLEQEALGMPLKSDKAGWVQVSYPRHVSQGIDASSPATSLSLLVHHGDYGLSEVNVTLGPAIEPVILTPATRLVLSAHPLDMTTPLQEVGVDQQRRLRLRWQKEKPGSLSTRLREPVTLRIVAKDKKGRLLFGEPITLSGTGENEQHVAQALRPGRTIHGRISDEVPRPIREGRVFASVVTPMPGREEMKQRHEEVMHWVAQAPVRTDGTFTIADLPEGVITLEALTPTHYATLFYKGGEAPIVLPASPSSGATITVSTFDGKPIPGATVSLQSMTSSGARRSWEHPALSASLVFGEKGAPSPAFFSEVYAGFKGSTLEDGTVRFTGVPPGWYSIRVVKPGNRSARSGRNAFLRGGTHEAITLPISATSGAPLSVRLSETR